MPLPCWALIHCRDQSLNLVENVQEYGMHQEPDPVVEEIIPDLPAVDTPFPRL